VAKNALLLDAVPVFIFMFNGYDCGAFGFGLQYERRLYKKLSLIGRYDYFGVWDFSDSGYYNSDYVNDWSSHIHSFETHARYYPTGKAFFLDGMLGYYINTINGSYYTRTNRYYDGSYRNVSEYDHYSSGTYDYFKWGASLGWRIWFGKERGFTWELSLGWNFAFNYDSDIIDVADRFGVFFGGAGPRFVSAFGWRF
jgi:hypothetical protein